MTGVLQAQLVFCMWNSVNVRRPV